jgi:hypothetical protein
MLYTDSGLNKINISLGIFHIFKNYSQNNLLRIHTLDISNICLKIHHKMNKQKNPNSLNNINHNLHNFIKIRNRNILHCIHILNSNYKSMYNRIQLRKFHFRILHYIYYNFKVRFLFLYLN